ncbi:MAG TPA: OmpA family protein [Anaeromyxobacter sp.]|nr:OmpA family protein [Anaeromyxobacter sp.]
MKRRAVVAALLAVAAGCATGGKLRQGMAVVRADIEKAKRSGAQRCAPKELALAEANVDFAEVETDYGHASRAQEHVKLAEQSVKKALELSKTCGPTQVTVAKKTPEPEPPPKAVLVIEKTDKDGDGIPDLDDACPELPGRPEFNGCPDTDGDGIPDSEDACPGEAGTKETQGCPIAKDSDGDAVPDDIDRCPLDPEDKDAFQDEDGCPDADNDGDGIVDKADACPNEAGTLENRGCPVTDKDGDGVNDDQDKCPAVAGLAENAGCPDVDTDGDLIVDRVDKCPQKFGAPPDGCPKFYSLVEVKKEKIEIKQQVHFATAKYRVLPDSFPLLNQVVEALTDFPKIRVSIEGHTDSVGGEAMNMRLSQRRAEAVRDYLVAKGIPPDRLEAIGFGPTKPIASNKTARGKAQNRRTEFRIVSME